MIITRVSGTNLMGSSFSWEPAALNFVSGTNDTGKTRLAVAIKLALLNRPPAEVDNTPREIHRRLASGDVMDVETKFDSGMSIHREWSLVRDTVKHKSHVPRELDGATPLVMLEAADYFSRSARGRVEMVFAVAKLGDVSWKSMAAELEGKAGQRVTVAHSSQSSVQEWLENALSAVEQERSSAAADARRHTGALQSFAEMQLDTRPATRSVEEIDKEIGTVQSERAMKLARDVTLNGELTKWDNEIAPRLIELGASVREAGDPPAREFDFERLRAEQRRLQKELTVAQQAEKALADWKRSDDARLVEMDRLAADIADQRDEVKRIPGIERKIKTLVGKATKKCKTCKQPIVNAADAQALATHRSNLAELQNISAQLNRDVAERARMEGQKKEQPTAPPMPSEKVQEELSAVEADIAAFTAMGQVTVWRQEIESYGTKPDHSAERAQIKTEVDALDNREMALKEERGRADTDAHDRRRMAEARTAQAAAVSKEAAMKGAKDWLIEKKGELIEKVFGPLLETSERFLRGIFPQPLEYVEGEIVMRSGTTLVTEATFGGARRAIVHAALQVSLGVNSPCRIVVMDELWRLHSQNIKPLLANVQQAHAAGVLDQFVGIRPDAIQKVKGFTFFEATGQAYVRS